MAVYKAVSKAHHTGKTWKKLSHFKALADEQTVPLVAAEFVKACVAFPIAWVRTYESFEPIALLGLRSNENLFISTSYQWRASYLPVYYRAQPFRLMPIGKDSLALGVREDVGRVSDDGGGDPFFDQQGELSESLAEFVCLLQKVEANREVTAVASGALNAAGLLEPWTLAPVIHGQLKQLVGLYRISQEKLDKVGGETLEQLRNTGALAMAYCQQISQQRVRRLEALHEQRTEAETLCSQHPADQGSFALGDEDAISFKGVIGNSDNDHL